LPEQGDGPCHWYGAPSYRRAFDAAIKIATSSKKVKLTESDIKLPLRLLYYSDNSTEGNRIKLESTCRLSESNVKKVLRFCFDMLANDDAREAAEIDLLNTIVFLCERVDYVAYLRPHTDIMEIMPIIDVCLSQDGRDISVAAARIFGSVFESCYELGLGLHLLMPNAIKCVSAWCRERLEASNRANYDGLRELPYLLRGVTALIRSHPEQAIRPLTRRGRYILSLALRSYPKADSANRNAMHGYFLAHL
jgi:hypothetical protein